MKKIFDISIKTKILDVQHGSIILFFDVFLTAFSLISGYKGIFESAELIRKQLDRLLELALAKRFNRNKVLIDVETEYPIVPTSEYQSFRLWSEPTQRDGTQRDGFFYYLLSLNIILLILIGILVYKAVIKTYFP